MFHPKENWSSSSWERLPWEQVIKPDYWFLQNYCQQWGVNHQSCVSQTHIYTFLCRGKFSFLFIYFFLSCHIGTMMVHSAINFACRIVCLKQNFSRFCDDSDSWPSLWFSPRSARSPRGQRLQQNKSSSCLKPQLQGVFTCRQTQMIEHSLNFLFIFKTIKGGGTR